MPGVHRVSPAAHVRSENKTFLIGDCEKDQAVRRRSRCHAAALCSAYSQMIGPQASQSRVQPSSEIALCADGVFDRQQAHVRSLGTHVVANLAGRVVESYCFVDLAPRFYSGAACQRQAINRHQPQRRPLSDRAMTSSKSIINVTVASP